MWRNSFARIISVKSVGIFLYIAAVVGIVLFGDLKRLCLCYDPIDYSFYAQFAARLLDVGLSKSLFVQPVGFNFLGYYGTEGIYSIHQSLHLEIIKYVYALVFRLWNSPVALYLLVASLYFLPIIYLSKIHRVEQKYDQEFILLFMFTYISFPSVLSTVTFDLRPRILLGPFWLLSFLAIIYRRPLIEKIICFGLLFLAREEAIILGSFCIALNLFSEQQKRKALAETGILTLAWIGYLFLTISYFKWTGYQWYPEEQSLPNLLPFLAAPIVTMTVLAFLAIRNRIKNNLSASNQLVQLLIIISSSLPLIIRLKTDLANWVSLGRSPIEIAFGFLTGAKLQLYFVFTLLLIIMAWKLAQKHGTFLRIWGVSLVFFLVISTYRSINYIQDYQKQAKLATIVFQVVENTNPYQTHILTDEQTFQAFFNYEHAIIYNRLPWSIAQEKRFFPDNYSHLSQLISQMEYAVITNENFEILNTFLHNTNTPYKIMARNARYSVLEINP